MLSEDQKLLINALYKKGAIVKDIAIAVNATKKSITYFLGGGYSELRQKELYKGFYIYYHQFAYRIEGCLMTVSNKKVAKRVIDVYLSRTGQWVKSMPPPELHKVLSINKHERPPAVYSNKSFE